MQSTSCGPKSKCRYERCQAGDSKNEWPRFLSASYRHQLCWTLSGRPHQFLPTAVVAPWFFCFIKEIQPNPYIKLHYHSLHATVGMRRGETKYQKNKSHPPELAIGSNTSTKFPQHQTSHQVAVLAQLLPSAGTGCRAGTSPIMSRRCVSCVAIKGQIVWDIRSPKTEICAGHCHRSQA